MTTINPEELLVKLLGELNQIHSEGSHNFDSLQQSVYACAATLDSLRAFASGQVFKHDDLEIYFFKQIKPAVEGRLMYFLKLLDILTNAPLYEEDDGKDYWTQTMKSVQSYIHRFGTLWQYFHSGADHFDQQYFRRPRKVPATGMRSIRLLSESSFETPKSFAFACITASRMLIDYCRQQLGKQAPTLPYTFTWTGSAQALTEVVYGFNEMQVLDGKRHEIAKVKAFFERVFNFPLNNIYKNWEHIRLRKKSRTVFFDETIMALGKRADYDDLNALG